MPNIRKSKLNPYKKNESYSPRNIREKLLVEIIHNAKSEDEIAALLRDLMTLPEIEEFANRVTIAKKLLENESYQEIAKDIQTSTTTVTRVAHWLFSGCGGYYRILNRVLGRKDK